jgi:hypothetical protein
VNVPLTGVGIIISANIARPPIVFFVCGNFIISWPLAQENNAAVDFFSALGGKTNICTEN